MNTPFQSSAVKALGCWTTVSLAVPHLLAQPIITRQPANQSVSVGATAVFQVTATSTRPITYQWRHQHTPLAWATNASLTLTNVQMADAGPYIVAVTDGSGPIDSNPALLEVDAAFTKITTGLLVAELAFSSDVTWADYDGDGYADLFIPRYNTGRSMLYHNNRDGTFTSITNAVFPLPPGAWHTAAWADFDNDGWPDLWVAREGGTAWFYFNHGDGTFTGIQGPAQDLNAGSAAVADYDGDGLLDLDHGVTASGNGSDTLYRNLGGRAFKSMTSNEVGSIVGGKLYGLPAWADYDDDGFLDLYHADMNNTRSVLFHNDGTGRFQPVTNALTLDRSVRVIAGGWADYDNDGRLDLWAAAYDSRSALYRNLDHGQFEKVSVGLEVQGPCNALSWGDYDNDGFLDLFLAFTATSRNVLLRSKGDGTFESIRTGSILNDQPAGASVATAWLDYDNDGFLDLLVINGNPWGGAMPPNFLYRNNGNPNAWLKIKPIGTVSNRDGVGAKVRVQATYAGQARWQRRDISGGDSFNGNHLIAHFGLGDATNVEALRIEWPSGILQTLTDVPVRQLLTVTEPLLPTAVLPASLDVSLGSTVSFRLNATSAVPWVCQWRFNDVELADETNVTLHLTGVQTNQAGSYTAFVSNGTNGMTTRPASLSVFDRPLITAQPTHQFARPGSNVTFSVSAYSPAPITCQWQANGTNIAGATNATLSLVNVSLAQVGEYRVAVSDSAGTVLSAVAMLTLLVDPVIVQQPCSVSVAPGGSVTLSVQVTNTATLPIGYRWRRGSTTVAHVVVNKYVNFLTLTNCQGTTNYEVIVTNLARMSTLRSSNAVVTVLPDADADGLPDPWEIACGISQATAPHGTADDDGDGLSNLDEYTAGTDPTNALSYVKVDAFALADGGTTAVLQFLAVSNQTYTLQYREAVEIGEWSRLVDVVATGTNRVVDMRDPAAVGGAQRFYRLVTPRIP